MAILVSTSVSFALLRFVFGCQTKLQVDPHPSLCKPNSDNTQAQAHAHTDTQAHRQTDTHRHTDTDTQTHTHTHARALPSSLHTLVPPFVSIGSC